jgi:hypothetical protein
MVWMFSIWNVTQVAHFGSALAFGVVLFAYNIARTLLRVPKWNVVAGAVASALGWICLAILAGLCLSAAKITFDPDATPTGLAVEITEAIARQVRRFDPLNAMHAHAHLGAVGFFVMLIVGISYKLIPMFTLSEVQSKRRAVASIVLLNVGLAGSFGSILLRSVWKVGFALMICAALAIYGWELIAILRARKRGPLDWGIKYFLTAVSLLAPVSLLGVVLSWPGLPMTAFTGQLENIYGFAGLIGVISFAIMGMLYKIIPFLIWFGTYSKHIGRMKVPALAEMYSTRWQTFGYWTFLAGLLVTIIGTLAANAVVIRGGSGLIGLSVASLLINAGRIMRHYFRPQLVPFNVQPAKPKPAYV